MTEKTITVYICETCNKEYDDFTKALTCEAKHLGLTLNEYKEYLVLLADVKFYTNKRIPENKELIEKRNAAINKVKEFKEKHNIKEV